MFMHLLPFSVTEASVVVGLRWLNKEKGYFSNPLDLADAVPGVFKFWPG